MDSNLPQLIDDICSPEPARVAAALQAAAPHRETLSPVLLARLLQAAAEPEMWDGDNGRPTPIFLLYLAAAWQLTEAHSLAAALLQLPSKQCDKMLGDFITEGAKCVLADTWPDDLRAITAIALDTQAEPFARDAAMDAAALLVMRGRLPREDALALFGRVASSSLDPKSEDDSIVATGLVSTIMDLSAWELRGTVIALFDRGLVEASWVGDESEVLAKLERGAVAVPDACHFPPPITDAWEKVKGWCFFDPLNPGRQPWTLQSPSDRESDEPATLDLTPPAPDKFRERPQPYHSPAKIGRNDPCPCGSGKKYKKCCGA